MPDSREPAASIVVNDDPFSTISQWLDEASESEPNNPEAMSVATVDEDGLPNVRILLLKGIDGVGVPGRGLVFYTNSQSSKGHELSANPKAALLFHWKSLGRQIRLRGTISMASDQEADAYFASRPRESRVGAWASDQSRALDNRKILEDRLERFTEEFKGGDVARPPHWLGYRLTPLEIEFWQNGEFRLHHRLLYTRGDDGAPWTTRNLFP